MLGAGVGSIVRTAKVFECGGSTRHRRKVTMATVLCVQNTGWFRLSAQDLPHRRLLREFFKGGPRCSHTCATGYLGNFQERFFLVFAENPGPEGSRGLCRLLGPHIPG